MILNKIPKPPNIKLFKISITTVTTITRTAALCFVLISVLFTPVFAREQGRVKSGDFLKEVVLTGSIQAREAERFVVPSTNTWRIQIKWMAEEGTHLKPGDPAVRFDTSNLATEIENLILSLQAKEEEKLQKLQDYNHQKFEVEVKLKQAEVDYEKKKIDAEIPKGLESNFKYDKNQLELKRAKQTLENARTEKKVKLSTLQSGLKRLDLEIEEERRNLKNKQDMLDSLILRAKTAGTFMWGRHRWNRQKIQIGDNVNATWTIATIPVPESMRVEAWVNETQIRNIIPGQKVDLYLDAYQGRTFTGVIQDVLRSAEKKYHWGKARYFSAIIQLDKLDQAIMKPGMSVKCVVKAASFKDVLLIPLNLAGYDGGKFVVTPAGKTPVTVTPLGFNRSILALDKKEAAQLGIEEGTKLEAPQHPETAQEGHSEN